MTRRLLHEYGQTHDIIVTFANTGLEHEKTLDFVKQCDDQFKFGTIWLEAVVGPARVGIRHRIVTYETASRKGEPFEAFIAKHGIPNVASPQCTSRLKTEVMEHYLKTRGWTRGRNKVNYDTAIGIRADEFDRMSKSAAKQRWIYPLVKWGVTKEDVLHYFRNQPFDLELPGEHYGNCVTCWKKSYRKLMTIAKEEPARFDFCHRMEQKYSQFRAKNESNRTNRRVFFREEKSTMQVLEMAKQPFIPYSDAKPPSAVQDTFNDLLDIGSGCSESCEIGSDES